MFFVRISFKFFSRPQNPTSSDPQTPKSHLNTYNNNTEILWGMFAEQICPIKPWKCWHMLGQIQFITGEASWIRGQENIFEQVKEV